MKKLRLLPGAAGVIALTATIGFVDGQREIEPEGYLRDKMTQERILKHVAANGPESSNTVFIRPGDSAYVVKIKRGDIYTDVIIDAVSGKILTS